MPKLRSFKKLERRLVKDTVPQTTAEISMRMARVRRTGTAPEVRVRQYLSNLGLRYRVKNRNLPGAPDLANRSNKWVVFCHGCFWHRHDACTKATMPKTNESFWRLKFAANVARDARVTELLTKLGYTVVTIWECQTRDAAVIGEALSQITNPITAKK
jgi:DNA mismatch endonuclease (patch repair protein)